MVPYSVALALAAAGYVCGVHSSGYNVMETGTIEKLFRWTQLHTVRFVPLQFPFYAKLRCCNRQTLHGYRAHIASHVRYEKDLCILQEVSRVWKCTHKIECRKIFYDVVYERTSPRNGRMTYDAKNCSTRTNTKNEYERQYSTIWQESQIPNLTRFDECGHSENGTFQTNILHCFIGASKQRMTPINLCSDFEFNGNWPPTQFV